MVSEIQNLTNIESLFSGKGEQQISPQILEMLGEIISKNLNINQNKEVDINFYELYKSVEDQFEKWLFNKFSNNYARCVNNTTKKIFLRSTKSIQDIYNLLEEGYVNKKTGEVSFRVFLNYIEKNELLDEIILLKARKKIKINNKRNRKRDVYVPTKTDLQTSLEILKSGEYPIEAYYIYKFLLESGCRFTELEHFFDTIKQIILNNNKEEEKKKITRNNNLIVYDNFYIRGKKSSFYLFSSKDTFENLQKIAKNINSEVLTYIKRKIQRDERVICLKYLRKYNFTKLIQDGIDMRLADFVQGRDSQDVGSNHYLGKKEILIPLYSSFIEKFTKELYN